MDAFGTKPGCESIVIGGGLDREVSKPGSSGTIPGTFVGADRQSL